MATVHINIGSNLGNRMDNINRGVDALRRLLAVSADPAAADTIVSSSPVESDPWGFDSANRFVNIGVNIDTSLPPLELLDITQQVERMMGSATHRAADGVSYIDRILDIDIIFYGNLVMDTPRLTLPHPHWRQRDFVVIPLRQLNPTYPLSDPIKSA